MNTTPDTQRPRLCLTMMVKNEAHIITRCLDSIVDMIDYWVICDTGSTDGTQDVIRGYFEKKKIPGELHQHEWKNYGYNRSLTLRTARNKADYLLLADADYIFHIQDKHFTEQLTAPAYEYYNIGESLKYTMLKLLNGDDDWHYVGVTHEYLQCRNKPDFQDTVVVTNAIHVEERYDGGNRADKYDNDIRLLTQGLQDEPENTRYMFYLARSYHSLQQYENAIRYYQMRIDAGGWVEEVFYSYHSITECLIAMDRPLGEIMEWAMRGYAARPQRLESLYELIRYCRIHEHYEIGYLIGKLIAYTAFPAEDRLFVHKDIYDWKLKDEISVCAYHVGDYRESMNLARYLLTSPQVPDDSRQRIQENIRFCEEKLMS